MTYRSDHDAALARVDALEAENARLAEQNAMLRMRLYPPPAGVPAPRPSARPTDEATAPATDWSDWAAILVGICMVALLFAMCWVAR